MPGLFFDITPDKKENSTHFQSYFNTVFYKSGDIIFNQGSPGDSAYIINKGMAEVSIQISDTNRKKRLTTLSDHTMFGEMALLTQAERSASVKAIEDTICHQITIDNFNKLKIQHPEFAIAILSTMGKILTTHLHRATLTIEELEQ